MTSMREHFWMRAALALADEAAHRGEVPVGAVLVDAQGVCLGRGYNQPIASADPTGHAELMALRQACLRVGNYRLPFGCHLYVTLEPCTMCFGALVHARLCTLHYATNEPRAGVLGSALALHEAPFYNHKIDVSGGVLAEVAAQKMQNFFAKRRKRPPL